MCGTEVVTKRTGASHEEMDNSDMKMCGSEIVTKRTGAIGKEMDNLDNKNLARELAKPRQEQNTQLHLKILQPLSTY